jgi:valine dehydrogenase (NAD+)
MRDTISDPFTAAPGHQQVTFINDQQSGLRGIIAIYSTKLGPALGGTRCYPYPTVEAALDDVLRLSHGMTYKAACAGLDLGGGKAVIIADPKRDKTDHLLRAYGRFLAGLGGRFITSVDIGTNVDDMQVVARECPHIAGLPVASGGSGDPSPLTAFGVLQAMRAALQHRAGTGELSERRIGILGVGKVGWALTELLAEQGARVLIADCDRSRVDPWQDRHESVQVVDPGDLLTTPLDVLAPCAMGGVLDDQTIPQLKTEVICGAANNQLARADHAQALADLDVLYIPDYVANAGGLIQVADELNGYSETRARASAARIYETVLHICRDAAQAGTTTTLAADRLAEDRMRQMSQLRDIHLPAVLSARR